MEQPRRGMVVGMTDDGVRRTWTAGLEPDAVYRLNGEFDKYISNLITRQQGLVIDGEGVTMMPGWCQGGGCQNRHPPMPHFVIGTQDEICPVCCEEKGAGEALAKQLDRAVDDADVRRAIRQLNWLGMLPKAATAASRRSE